MIEITSTQQERVNLILGGIRRAPEKAFTNAIKRGLDTIKTHSGREFREVYNVKQSDITANQNIKVKKANWDKLEGAVLFAGTVIPLKKFKVSPGSPKRQTVSVSVLKAGSGKRLESAYVANLGKYGVGVFERLTSQRNSSQQLFGPSPAHMAENVDVMDRISNTAQKIIDSRVEHEITRILNGFGR